MIKNQMEQGLTVEKRKLARYPCRLKVYLEENDELLGYAEDIHLEGMRLKSEQPVQDKVELKVWFGVNTATEDMTGRISLSMYRVWSAFPAGDMHFYYSGMHFVPPSEETLDAIQELIDELVA